MPENMFVKTRLNQYHSKMNIMRIICNKSASHCNKRKNLLTLLLITLSFSNTVLTSLVQDSNTIKIPTVILNAIITFIVAIQRAFKYEEKSANFNKYSQSYNKLSHEIDKNVGNTSLEFLNLIVSLYDNITENINDYFPSSVVNTVKKEFAELDTSMIPAIFDEYSVSSSFVSRGIHSPILRLPNNSRVPNIARNSSGDSNFIRAGT